MSSVGFYHPLPAFATVGTEVLAYYAETEQFFRARIMRINEEHQMVFLDWIGWDECWRSWAPGDLLRELTPRNIEQAVMRPQPAPPAPRAPRPPPAPRSSSRGRRHSTRSCRPRQEPTTKRPRRDQGDGGAGAVC